MPPSPTDPRTPGPYRAPVGLRPAPRERAPGWAVFLIDALLVLFIGVTVLTVERWGGLVDTAARRFVGF